MIRIVKGDAPSILTSRGVRERNSMCSAFDRSESPAAFKDDIYSHQSVKKALVAAQHGKCCYCETRIGWDSDVEHFRPKSGFKQTPKGPLVKPGYYWLVYSWDNLFLSCIACNQRHKASGFPLLNPAARARSHHDPLEREQPLYVDPSADDPESHIEFWDEVPRARSRSRRGEGTINGIRLGRDVLDSRRRDRLGNLICLREVLGLEQELSRAAGGRKLLAVARKLLAESVEDHSEYASMARCSAEFGFRRRYETLQGVASAGLFSVRSPL